MEEIKYLNNTCKRLQASCIASQKRVNYWALKKSNNNQSRPNANTVILAKKNVKEAVQIAVKEGKYTHSEHAYPRAHLLNHIMRTWSTKVEEFWIHIQLNSIWKTCHIWTTAHSKAAIKKKLRKKKKKKGKYFCSCLILYNGWTRNSVQHRVIPLSWNAEASVKHQEWNG